jgi:hypothetical protein
MKTKTRFTFLCFNPVDITVQKSGNSCMVVQELPQLVENKIFP